VDLDHVVTTLTRRHDLTRREQSVLRLVFCGHDNGEIGRKLDMAPRTAKSHVEHIWQKLCVHSRAQLMGLLFAPAP
jgi:DNA-binding NarL/FixJ family response regulator